MTCNRPSIPVISTVRGDWGAPDEFVNPDYWVDNIRHPVRFADAVEKLFDRPEWIMLEAGPGNILTTLAKQHPNLPPEQVLLQSLRHPKVEQDDNVFAMNTLGRLWSCGYPVEWERIYKDNPVHKISLPTYAFQRVRCWIDPEPRGAESLVNSAETGEKMNGVGNNEGSEKRNIVDELTAIWQDFLGIENIKKDDDFFELGGNSLVAVQLFDELKYKLGIQLPLSALFEAPTIEQIAKLIEPAEDGTRTKDKTQTKKKHTSALVKIQGEGKERPFFCVHGHFGNVLFLYELANLLGKNRPFYGVQSVGLSGEENPLTSIEDMADRIIKEMMEVQPRGPYSFGGYCYGTLVSIEIAKKLDEMGETYDPIVMIDPQPTAYSRVIDDKVVKSYKKITFEQKKSKHEGRISDKSLIESIQYFHDKISNKLKFNFKIKAFNLYIRSKRFLNMKMPASFRDVELANMVAHDNYVSKLKGDFKADVELILSKKVTEKFSSDPASDWAGLTKGNMNVYLIEDDGVIMSAEMFNKPYVQGTAGVIKSIWKLHSGELPDKNRTSVRDKYKPERREAATV
ncbi:MAG: thioesterase domain-containing protein [Balneolaceae bacterium]